MEILQIVGFGLVAAVLIVILRHQKPEVAMLVSIAAGVVIFLFVLDKVAAVVTVLKDLATRA
ncbi:MAG: stage III sporulation AC/AD family protein, partial [Bacillota bacterium]|nr:stage III sporulation AC/AD family protein [Bacillota bacterium]